MCTYASSREKRESFYRKSELCWFPAAILVHQNCTPLWLFHTKLYKSAWNVWANNSETVGHKDLGLGQIVSIQVFFNISFSWLLPLDRFQFIFLVTWQWKRSIGCYFKVFFSQNISVLPKIVIEAHANLKKKKTSRNTTLKHYAVMVKYTPLEHSSLSTLIC